MAQVCLATSDLTLHDDGGHRPAMEHNAAARAGQAQSPFVTGPFLWVTGYVTRVLLFGLVTADEGQVVAEHLVTGTYSRALRPHYGYGARSAHVPLRSSERALRAPSGLVDMPCQLSRHCHHLAPCPCPPCRTDERRPGSPCLRLAGTSTLVLVLDWSLGPLLQREPCEASSWPGDANCFMASAPTSFPHDSPAVRRASSRHL